MSERLDNRVRKGKAIIFAFTLFVFGLEAVVFLRVEHKDPTRVAWPLLVVALFFFLYQGRRWLKHVCAAALVLGVALYVPIVLDHGEIDALGIAGLAAAGVAVGFAALMLLSPSVAAFLRVQRGAVPADDSAFSPAPPPLPSAAGRDRYQGLWFSLIFVAIALYGYAAFGQGSGDPMRAGAQLGRGIGRALVLGLVSWLLWRFAFKKTRGAGLLIFAILFHLVAYHDVVVTPDREEAARSTAEQMASMLDGVVDGTSTEDIEIDEASAGELAPFLRLVKDMAAKSEAVGNRVLQDIEKLHLDDCFEEVTLSDPDRMKEMRARLERGIRIYEEGKRDLLKLMNEYGAACKRLELPPEMRRGMLEGHEEGAKQGQAFITNLFALRQDGLRHGDKALAFLLTRQGKYRFEDGGLLFDADADAETYNRHLADVTACEEKVVRMLRDFQRRARRHAEEIRRQAR